MVAYPVGSWFGFPGGKFGLQQPEKLIDITTGEKPNYYTLECTTPTRMGAAALLEVLVLASPVVLASSRVGSYTLSCLASI